MDSDESAFREGSWVVYVGDDPSYEIGDKGRVLTCAGEGTHVRWGKKTAHADEIALVSAYDLVPYQRGQTEEPSVSFFDFSVREAYDESGSPGLLNAMNRTGHLKGFAPIAERARLMVIQALRDDPSFVEAAVDLSEDEQEDLLGLAATALLRDAFGG